MDSIPLFYQYPDKTLFKTEVVKQLSKNFLLANCFSQIQEWKNYPHLTGVILSRTLAYPGGAGQPADRGVIESDNDNSFTAELFSSFKFNNQIIHLLDRPIPSHIPIWGRIDWAYRFDYMQQHSAQHLISAILFQRFQIQTECIYFGTTDSTIEISSPPLSDFEQCLIEKELSTLQQKAVRIQSYEAIAPLSKTITLRKEACPQSKESRLVSIGKLDTVSCGGVHCLKASETAPFLIDKWEKSPKGSIITFVAGDRALSKMKKMNRQLLQSQNSNINKKNIR